MDTAVAFFPRPGATAFSVSYATKIGGSLVPATPTAPPRYAFRLEDLRAFHLVRASCHVCAHKAIIPQARVDVLPRIFRGQHPQGAYATAHARAPEEFLASFT
jgi:hypothetical protein